MSDTRMPTQKRSIEKRNKIINKGFELMCENGYYNTNTTQIAEYAGVSTGIIYQYFNDKKEIFLEGAKNYADNIMYPMIDVFSNETIDINNLDKLIESIIDKFITSHTISKRAHEEIMAMSHLDDDISNVFKNSELNATKKIITLLKNNNIIISNQNEKVHIIVGIIDNLCHEIVYHSHKEIDYNIMKKNVVQIISNTLKE